MLELFVSAVLEFGPSSRVRTDQLVENTEVAKFMLTHPFRGPGQKRFIAGKSCHNQCIEQLSRDVFCTSLYKFYCLFCFLEDQRFLDISNEFHLYVLRLVQEQPSEVFYVKRCFRNFTKFTGKHLCQSIFLIKLQASGLQLY